MNPLIRLPAGIAENLIKAAWADGFRTGAFAAAVVGIVIALLWSKK